VCKSLNNNHQSSQLLHLNSQKRQQFLVVSDDFLLVGAAAVNELYHVVAGGLLAIVVLEARGVAPSLMLVVELREVLILDLLLADGNLLRVWERVGHPLLLVALFILLLKHGDLHLFEGTASLRVE
jgi:hypothetical protein